MSSIANILLEVTGDSDDARRELADVASDLALFGRETAEAEADIDTTSAQANLDELKARLAAFSAEDATAEVNVAIAKAQADIAVLQAELSRIDGEDVTVDVDVRRGVVEKIASLTRQIDGLDSGAESASSGGISSLISSFLGGAKGASIFGVSLETLAYAAPVLITMLVAVVGQIVAVVASAASAAGGIGALAIAFGSLLLPAIALGVGAFANFKDEADTAGTAAHALKETFGDVAESFKTATSGGSKALFAGLADALRDIDPLVKSLAPAFTRLGNAGGDAFRLLGEQFSSPAWSKFFEFAIDSLARLTPLFARSFGAFSKILANIAQAAMPFLISGMRTFTGFLEGLAGKTSNIEKLRGSIGGMVDSLKAWGELLGGVVHLAGAFVKAFAPVGDSIVSSLGEGADNLAEWLESSDGLKKIQSFFEDTGPLASELGKLVLNVALALIQFGQLAAPALTPLIHLLNDVFGVVNKIFSWANDHNLGDIFAKATQPLGLIKAAISAIGPAATAAFNTVKGVVSDIVGIVSAPIKFQLEVARDVLGVISDIWGFAKDKVSTAISFVLKAPREVLGVVQGIWASARDKVKSVINFVLKAPREVLGVVSSIWSSAKGKISDAISFVFRAPRDVIGAAADIWNAVKGKISDGIDFVLNLPGVGGLVSAAKAIWDAINSALPDITIDIDIPTPSLPSIPHATGLRGNLPGHLAEVGEMGPELMYVPPAADIYTATGTRRILRALADGISGPLTGGGASPALAGAGGGGTTIVNNVTPIAAGGSPDPEILAAQLGAAVRARQGT